LDNAAWNHQHKLRLGTVYRDEMVRILSKRPDSGWVLDVGCHDGYWLNTLSVDHKIGVDPEPSHVAPDVAMVRGDGTRLPFPEQTFNWVFAMDVIEHVEDDQAFASSLSRMVGPGGRLFLSTPSESIRLTPPVLTGWISRQWGHTLRLGYSIEKSQSLFEPLLDVKITTWNAPSYRFWYLPVRFLSIISPRLAAKLVRRIARADAQKTDGLQGFLILEGVWQAKKGDEG
jgi:SAM-dependent methyltransferase